MAAYVDAGNGIRRWTIFRGDADEAADAASVYLPFFWLQKPWQAAELLLGKVPRYLLDFYPRRSCSRAVLDIGAYLTWVGAGIFFFLPRAVGGGRSWAREKKKSGLRHKFYPPRKTIEQHRRRPAPGQAEDGW